MLAACEAPPPMPPMLDAMLAACDAPPPPKPPLFIEEAMEALMLLPPML